MKNNDAITIQKAILGNKNAESFTGIVYSRDINDENPTIKGSYTVGKQNLEENLILKCCRSYVPPQGRDFPKK